MDRRLSAKKILLSQLRKTIIAASQKATGTAATGGDSGAAISAGADNDKDNSLSLFVDTFKVYRGDSINNSSGSSSNKAIDRSSTRNVDSCEAVSTTLISNGEAGQSPNLSNQSQVSVF